MISTFIQLAVIVLLAYAVIRANKRDLITDMRKKDELCELFNNQDKKMMMLHQDVLANIDDRNQIIKNEINHAYDSMYPILITIAEKQYSELSQRVAAQCKEIREICGILEGSNNTGVEMGKRLLAIETPIIHMFEAQTLAESRKGESLRSLRRKVQNMGTEISGWVAQCKQLSDQVTALKSETDVVKTAAQEAANLLIEEIRLMQQWMDESGIPKLAMKKYLQREFKGDPPSVVCTRAMRCTDFQEQLQEPA